MTEHEELLMLRALAAKQAQELEASKRIIAGSMKNCLNAISSIWMRPGSGAIRKKESFRAVNPLCG